MHTQSPETSISSRNDDSSRANVVSWLDAPIFEQNTEGLTRNVDTDPQEDSVEALADSTDRKSDFSHYAGAIAVEAVIREIMDEAENKSSEAYGDIYTDPWALSNDYDPLFNEETSEQPYETDDDSYKPGFGIDD